MTIDLTTKDIRLSTYVSDYCIASSYDYHPLDINVGDRILLEDLTELEVVSFIPVEPDYLSVYVLRCV